MPENKFDGGYNDPRCTCPDTGTSVIVSPNCILHGTKENQQRPISMQECMCGDHYASTTNPNCPLHGNNLKND